MKFDLEKEIRKAASSFEKAEDEAESDLCPVVQYQIGKFDGLTMCRPLAGEVDRLRQKMKDLEEIAEVAFDLNRKISKYSMAIHDESYVPVKNIELKCDVLLALEQNLKAVQND